MLNDQARPIYGSGKKRSEPESEDGTIDIEQEENIENNKFNIISRRYKVKLNFSGNDYSSANRAVVKFFDKVHKTLVSGVKSKDKISAFINHPSLDMPIIIPFLEMESFTSSVLANSFIKVSQSKKGFLIGKLFFSIEVLISNYNIMIDKNFEIHSNVANLPEGKGRKSKCDIKGVIPINNSDDFCGIRAFIVGVELHERTTKVSNLTRIGNKEMNSRVDVIRKALNLNGPCGLDKIRELEIYFQKYQAVIYDDNSFTSYMPIYRGTSKSKKVFLYFTKNHYHVISSISTFFGTHNFCPYCLLPHNSRVFHTCEFICTSCKRSECLLMKVTKCFRCFKQINNNECLKLHESYCTHNKYCSICKKYYFNNHVCREGHRFCYNCKISVPFDHQCFIQKDELSDDNVSGYIFFDYEAMQETGVHIPNLVIAYKYSTEGWLMEKRYFYNNGDDVNNNFCEWLFVQENYIAICLDSDDSFVDNQIHSRQNHLQTICTTNLTTFNYKRSSRPTSALETSFWEYSR